jgi:SAM-dependent methyltransferase
MEFQHYTSQNASAWNEIAEIRHKSTQPASYYSEGHTSLDTRLVAAAGELNGISVLQLQCSTGEETLSWAILGAKATGVDISERQIELGREKAAEAGVEASFVVADVLDLPAKISNGSFDIVHTGGGSITWLPDLDRWAASVASSLRPGGRLLLHEEHPVAGVLFQGGNGQLVIESNYFARRETEAQRGWRHFKGGEDAREAKYNFEWPLGDVITALATNGMRIHRLEEFPSTAKWRFTQDVDAVAALPGSYLLIATRENLEEPSMQGEGS